MRLSTAPLAALTTEHLHVGGTMGAAVRWAAPAPRARTQAERDQYHTLNVRASGSAAATWP